jgi:NAD(P)-dependent dehydrogenase (short-subunit alcohol dehydrogenase family)
MATKTYLVTGASRGVGFELCKQLTARPDTRVVAAARRPEQAAELQALAQQAGPGRVEVVQLDTASSASIQACVDGLKQTLGHIDVVVNNAGILDSLAPFDQVTEQELFDCFQVRSQYLVK